MAIIVSPITERFAAEIGDIDLARPLSVEDAEAVKADKRNKRAFPSRFYVRE